MNRPAVRSALRTGRFGVGRAATRAGESRVFSTTSATFDDDGSRLPTSRERSTAAASALGGLTPRSNVIDLRSLGAPASAKPVEPSKVINLRSLRGTQGDGTSPERLGGGRFARGRRGGGGGGRSGGAGFQALNNRTLGAGLGSGFGDRPGFTSRVGGFGGREGRSGRGGQYGGREGRSGGTARRDGNNFRLAGVGGRGRGVDRNVAGMANGMGRGGRDDDEDEKLDIGGKLVFNAEEQQYINSVEQGVVTPYTPVVTLESLRGYGPALATDTTLGKVETALQSMRVLSGGRSFNSVSPFAHDVKDDFKRYFGAKKPLFFDTMAEKEWVEASRKGLKMHPPSQAIKSAIVQAAIAGKYQGPKYAETRNVGGLIANYLARDKLYTQSNVAMFEEKAQSLLPAKLYGNSGSKAQPTKAA